MIQIQNIRMFCANGTFQKGNIFIRDQRFVDQREDEDAQIIDGAGMIAIPGLTDLHFHGCVGHDFCEGNTEVIAKIAEYEASVGVTTIVPATMTLSIPKLEQVCRAAAEYRSEKGAVFCGIDLEGPFISEGKKGAQSAEHIKAPDVELFDHLNALSGGQIRIAAIAPEVEHAMEFIRKKSKDVVISIAHTEADYATVKKAIELGASHMTHLYNAMNGISHRAPGPIIAAADSDHVEAELICDGIHVHEAVVRNTFKMFGRERIIFISDSMEATGMPDGEYMLGGQEVTVKGHLCTLKGSDTIAGSATNLMDCMKYAVLHMGIPLEDAVYCSAVTPAKSVGIYDEYGSIEPGKIANLVLLDENTLEVKQVIQRGEWL